MRWRRCRRGASPRPRARSWSAAARRAVWRAHRSRGPDCNRNRRSNPLCYPRPQAMPLHEKKVVAVLPAYNAERTLRATYDDIPSGWVDEILLVDDCSRDRTVELARQLSMRVVVHKKNRGYGGNQKTCY